MQNSTTILGIIEMRLKGISYDDCRNRYGVGNSTVNLIMTRHLEKGIPLEVQKQMSAEEVEASFYPVYPCVCSACMGVYSFLNIGCCTGMKAKTIHAYLDD